jgi:hypothetical protein
VLALRTVPTKRRYQGQGDETKVWNIDLRHAHQNLKKIRADLSKVERAAKERQAAEEEELRHRIQLANKINHRFTVAISQPR